MFLIPGNYESVVRFHGCAISHKWNYTICDLLGLAFCCEHNYMEMHPGCCLINTLFLLLLSSIPWCGRTPTRSTVHTSGLCPVWGYSECSCCNHSCAGFCADVSLISPGRTPGKAVSGLQGSYMLSFWWNCPKGSALSHAHQQWPGAPVVPRLRRHLVWSAFGVLAILIGGEWRLLVLMCNFQVPHDVGRLSHACLPYDIFGKGLCRSSAHFLTGLVFKLFWFFVDF